MMFALPRRLTAANRFREMLKCLKSGTNGKGMLVEKNVGNQFKPNRAQLGVAYTLVDVQ